MSQKLNQKLVVEVPLEVDQHPKMLWSLKKRHPIWKENHLKFKIKKILLKKLKKNSKNQKLI